MREWLSGGAPPCQGGGRGFDPRLALFFFKLNKMFTKHARVAQRWSTSLPRRGSRVRSPSRALNKKRYPNGYLFLFRAQKRARSSIFSVPLRSAHNPRSTGPHAPSHTLNKKDIRMDIFFLFRAQKRARSSIVSVQLFVSSFSSNSMMTSFNSLLSGVVGLSGVTGSFGVVGSSGVDGCVGSFG